MFICPCDRIPLLTNYTAGLLIMSYWTCSWSVPPPGRAIRCFIRGSIKSTEVLVLINFFSLKVLKGQFDHRHEPCRGFKDRFTLVVKTVTMLSSQGTKYLNTCWGLMKNAKVNYSQAFSQIPNWMEWRYWKLDKSFPSSKSSFPTFTHDDRCPMSLLFSLVLQGNMNLNTNSPP